jgi:hypothetical protein
MLKGTGVILRTVRILLLFAGPFGHNFGHNRGRLSGDAAGPKAGDAFSGAAQESNLPSRGLHDRTGFEDLARSA